ncbi:hypothetical protein DSL92_01740 [Billgrantia gudaonensis]|uniref:Uncharacterized protein n=1 Tax=Billgrantia gudaonensis TaxID=376427 RepID=A0A432JKA9_9GAMM|nr:hypothetical protein DSL92_01740 [Halomonas gudaonensis]
MSDPAGYTLVENDRVLATRLTLAQLGPTLIAWLMRGLADAAPGRWSMPACGSMPRAAGNCAWTVTRQAGVVARSRRRHVHSRRAPGLGGRRVASVEPLGLPLSMEAERPTASLAPAVPIVGVLWQTDWRADAQAQSALDALGALLPRIVTADTGAVVRGGCVAALHDDWLAGCLPYLISAAG